MSRNFLECLFFFSFAFCLFIQESLDLMGQIQKGFSLGKLHDAGTALLLFSSVIYYWLQTVISYHVIKVGINSKCVFAFRLTLSCILTFTGIGYPFLKWNSYTKFSGNVSFWNPSDDGYILHVSSSVGEWIACLCLALYVVSFYKEFQTFSIEVSCVENNAPARREKGDYKQLASSKDQSDG